MNVGMMACYDQAKGFGGLQLMRGGEFYDFHQLSGGMKEQLAAASDRVQKMVEDQYRIYLKQLEPALNEIGIHRRRVDELTQLQSDFVDQLFEEKGVAYDKEAANKIREHNA